MQNSDDALSSIILAGWRILVKMLITLNSMLYMYFDQIFHTYPWHWYNIIILFSCSEPIEKLNQITFNKPSCDLFFNWDQWLGRICHLKIFLIYSSDSQLVWRSKIIKAILLEIIMGNISAKLFGICTSAVWYNLSFAFSFQLVEIPTLQVSLAKIYSFITILNSNIIFWPWNSFTSKFNTTPFSTSHRKNENWYESQAKMYVNRNCNISPIMLSLSSVSA